MTKQEFLEECKKVFPRAAVDPDVSNLSCVATPCYSTWVRQGEWIFRVEHYYGKVAAGEDRTRFTWQVDILHPIHHYKERGTSLPTIVGEIKAKARQLCADKLKKSERKVAKAQARLLSVEEIGT